MRACRFVADAWGENVTEITVEPESEDTFRVTVSETGSSTTHEVTVSPSDVERWAGEGSAGELIEASFRFLLEREPKESILSAFDLSVISRYFPEYPTRIADYL